MLAVSRLSLMVACPIATPSKKKGTRTPSRPNGKLGSRGLLRRELDRTGERRLLAMGEVANIENTSTGDFEKPLDFVASKRTLNRTCGDG
jgi:hypothetical protein